MPQHSKERGNKCRKVAKTSCTCKTNRSHRNVNGFEVSADLQDPSGLLLSRRTYRRFLYYCPGTCLAGSKNDKTSHAMAFWGSRNLLQGKLMYVNTLVEGPIFDP